MNAQTNPILESTVVSMLERIVSGNGGDTSAATRRPPSHLEITECC